MDILDQIFNAQKESRKDKVQNFLSIFEEESIDENVAMKTAEAKAKQIEDMERLKLKHEKEIEDLKKRQDRENDRLAGEKERESENDAISKKRESQSDLQHPIWFSRAYGHRSVHRHAPARRHIRWAPRRCTVHPAIGSRK